MIDGVILDLDGTLYRGPDEVPGAARFVRWLQEHGLRRMFVTNRANRGPDAIVAQLRGYGMPCEPQDVLTSGLATVEHLGKGTAYCIGEDAMQSMLSRAGFILTDRNPDFVIVSLDQSLTYEKLSTACRLIRGGARFVATNTDAAYCTDEGFVPGTGAIVAALVKATGAEPRVVGKPEPLIFELACKRMGLDPERVIAVGDNLATDVAGGCRAGLRTALILTGVSTRGDLVGAAIAPTWVVADFEELWKIIRTQ